MVDKMLRVLRRIVEAVWPPARARRRGFELLRSNLSAQQRREFDQQRRFEVRGGSTGHRYRIRRGWSMNIDEIDGRGAVLRTWCFYPKGRLSVGDIMLAQKIALETFELEALEVGNFGMIETIEMRPEFEAPTRNVRH